jgi:hypothetical protein
MNILFIFVILLCIFTFVLFFSFKEPYVFVHIPKTAGSSVKEFMKEYEIEYLGHEHNANREDAIIVFREPEDRFYSSFKYWKQECIEKNVCDISTNSTIKHFIEYIKTDNEKILVPPNYHKWHYLPQSNYLNEDNYKNVIIIKYDKDSDKMNDKLNKLIEYLQIPNKNIKLSNINLSPPFEYKLDNSDLEFLHSYYQKDFILYSKIQFTPELFKLVL